MLLLLSSFSKRVGKHTISNLIVLLHQPRQSNQLPVDSVSVRPAVVPVQSTPVVAASRSTSAKLQVPRPTFQSRSPAQSQQPTAAITHVSRVTSLIFTAATSNDIVLYLDTDAFWATTMLYHPILHSSQHVKWTKRLNPSGYSTAFGPALIVLIFASVQIRRGYVLNFDNARNRFSFGRGYIEYIHLYSQT